MHKHNVALYLQLHWLLNQTLHTLYYATLRHVGDAVSLTVGAFSSLLRCHAHVLIWCLHSLANYKIPPD